MKVLAIESSAVTASVAIMSENTLLAEYTINHKKTHSQTLLPMIEEIFKMIETEPAEIDVIAVSAGPGSFTGLRIGAATGKGMALALDKKMVAVPTLKAMAYNYYGDDRIICPIMDAKRQCLFAGIYRFDGAQLETLLDNSRLTFDEYLARLKDIILDREDAKLVFLGDGVDAARAYFTEHLNCEYTFAPAHQKTQRAASVAMCALDMIKAGEIVDSDSFKPDYLSPSQAERMKAAAKS